MQTRRIFALVAGAAMLLPAAGAVAADAPAKPATPDPVLVQVVAGDWRTPEAKARDAYRHPVEALTFWGLKPGMTILEVQPGAQSWWTEILAPYAKRTGGKFYVTGPDLVEPRAAGRGAQVAGRVRGALRCKPGPVRQDRCRQLGREVGATAEGHVRLHPDRALRARMDGHSRAWPRRRSRSSTMR